MYFIIEKYEKKYLIKTIGKGNCFYYINYDNQPSYPSYRHLYSLVKDSVTLILQCKDIEVLYPVPRNAINELQIMKSLLIDVTTVNIEDMNEYVINASVITPLEGVADDDSAILLMECGH